MVSDQQVIVDSSNSPVDVRSVCAADTDGDGDVDVFSASRGDGRVVWYENSGGDEPTFEIRTLSAQATTATSVAVGDLDGDGDVDVIASARGLNAVIWFENQYPELGFGPLQTVSSSAENVEWIHPIDLDQDGNLDVVSCLAGSGTVRWHKNLSEGMFASITLVDTIPGVRSCDSGDFDGDGDIDLVCAGAFSNRVVWLENMGSPDFAAHDIDVGLSIPVSVHAADLDNDQDMDVAVASMSDNRIVWYENGGGENRFGPSRTLSSDALGAASVHCDDLDSDGDMDVLSASQLSGEIVWYENRLEGIFEEHVLSTSAIRATAVIAADIGGDGGLDVVASSSGNDKISWYENSESLDFPERIIVQTVLDAPWYVDAGDLSGDGAPDLVVGSRADSSLTLFVNSGLPEVEFVPLSLTEDFYNGMSVHIADMNRDGRNDLLAASPLRNRLSLFINEGSLRFAERILSTTAQSISAVSGDLDGDGDLDAISVSSGGNSISWFENVSGGSFVEYPITENADRAVSVGVGDLDRDGDLDVFGAAESRGKIEWYENDGEAEPTFTVHPVVSDLGRVVQVIAADLDNDDHLDLVSASHRDETVHWYRNDGQIPPAFQQQTISDEAGGVLRIFASDLDLDDDLDVLSANSGESRVVYYENQGEGVFVERLVTGNDDYPTSVLAVDLDTDGDPDVVSTSLLEDRLSWHRNLLDTNGGTPTATPTGIHLTATPDRTETFMRFDLEPDGRIDSKDLIVLLESWRDAREPE